MDMTDARLLCPKPARRRTVQGRKTRAEATVKKAVRAACVERDGSCRIHIAWWTRDQFSFSPIMDCVGPPEWAHMHVKRRSKTRGMDPDVRHTTKDSLILCARHHAQYDNTARPRLFISALTRRGANGPLKFTRRQP